MLAKYESLPINSLFIDPTYQRDINHGKIKEWGKNFDDSLIGAIEVAERSNGTYAILDGQHRWHLLKSKNYKTVPCLVHSEMTVQEEALKFKELNANINRLSELEKFWAMIGACNSKHLEIMNLISKNGLSVARRSGSKSSQCYQIAAIGKIMMIEKTYGNHILDNTLSFVTNVWPGNGYSLKGLILEGVAIFLYRHLRNVKFNLKNAQKKFSILNTEIVLAKARDKSKLYGSGVQYNIADLLAEAYNKGLTQDNKLRWEGQSDK
jgi:hypothetical protein